MKPVIVRLNVMEKDVLRLPLYYMTLFCDVYYDFVTFSFGILGQVRYLIVSIADPCCLFNFKYEIICEKAILG